jgi:amidase
MLIWDHVKSKQAIFVEECSLGGTGATVAVKDTIDIAGHATRAGSRALADVAPAKRHAAVVDALIAAGCRIVGKTNLHEFAYGVTGINDYTGTPLNTRFPDRVPGGSSSGSAAAVAAGLADFAIGTDTGGSVRVPAACCGVAGFKPTFGRISRAGVMPEHTTLDCVGPFAPDVAGIERALAIIDPTYTAVAVPADPVIGIVEVDSEPAVAAAFARGLAALTLRRIPVALPGMAAAFDAGLAVIAAETYAAVGAYAESPLIGADIRDRLAAAKSVAPAALAGAERVRTAFRAEVDALLERVDVLVLPTMPVPTLTLEQGRDGKAAIRVTAFVRPFNLSGHPALTIPLPAAGGFSAGFQIVSRTGDDARLLAIARVIERSLAAAVLA